LPEKFQFIAVAVRNLIKFYKLYKELKGEKEKGKRKGEVEGIIN
jgi:hypothetical protein